MAVTNKDSLPVKYVLIASWMVVECWVVLKANREGDGKLPAWIDASKEDVSQ